jgi:uncharacterized protein
MVALLDVNVLIALCDPHHDFHQTALSWANEYASQGWASCPLTQNGCIRIVTQPSYRYTIPMPEAIETLQSACASPHHHFWPDDVSLLDAQSFDHSRIHGPRQLTDLYLLGLAVKHKGCLVTLDGQIPLSAIKGAKKQHLLVL